MATRYGKGWQSVQIIGMVLMAFGLQPAYSLEPAAPTGPRATGTEPTADFLAALEPSARDSVAAVMRAPTLTTRATDAPFFAQADLYDWLLDHPDRASLAWRRMGVPCVEIVPLERGRFLWKDEQGSELVWWPVGRFRDGIVWYATGQVKAAALVPTASVRAVAILQCPRQIILPPSPTATFTPKVLLYLQTDSPAATAALRILGPAVPRMAEQGAEQLLLFFAGPARRIFAYPEEGEKLLAPKLTKNGPTVDSQPPPRLLK